jgi:hypothetical protein
MVIPGLPLTGAGIEDRMVIKGLVDVGVWFSVLEEHELKLVVIYSQKQRRNSHKRALGGRPIK